MKCSTSFIYFFFFFHSLSYIWQYLLCMDGNSHREYTNNTWQTCSVFRVEIKFHTLFFFSSPNQIKFIIIHIPLFIIIQIDDCYINSSYTKYSSKTRIRFFICRFLPLKIMHIFSEIHCRCTFHLKYNNRSELFYFKKRRESEFNWWDKYIYIYC